MASVFYPLGRKGKHKKKTLVVSLEKWDELCRDPSSLQSILKQGFQAHDVLEQYLAGFRAGGVFNSTSAAARQLALSFLKLYGVALCKEVPVDAVRKLYEVVLENFTHSGEDDVLPASSRMKMMALDALTSLLLGLRVHETDPRLLKVHVQRLYNDLDPRRPAPHAATAGPPSLHRLSSTSLHLAAEHLRVAASECLRSIEVAFPGMLLSGGGRLLELSLAEAEGSTPAATQLAVTVLSHAAAGYLAQQAAAAAAAVQPAPHFGTHPQCTGSMVTGSARGGTASSTYTTGQSSSGCTSPWGRSAPPTEGYSSDGCEGGGYHQPTSPTLPEGEPLPAKLPPPSPRGVMSPAVRCASSAATSAYTGSQVGSGPAASASFSEAAAVAAGTPSTSHSFHWEAPEGGLPSRAASGLGGGAPPAAAGGGGGRSAPPATQLLSRVPTGLRHFYVPDYYKGPGAPGLEGCCLVLPMEGKKRLSAAVPHFLKLLPRVVVEDLPQMSLLLAPLIRVAAPPPQELQPLLEKHLRSNNLPLMQAVLMLLDELPSVYQSWEEDLITQLCRILVGRTATEPRIAALSWLLRRHHQQRYAKQRSLFQANWRAVLPAERDDVLLLTLKVKALTACIACDIGDVWEMAEVLNAWSGFWEASPTALQLRAASYMLRMLSSAECPPGSCCSEHRLKAVVVSIIVQMAATRPQYLPAMESFMEHCSPAVRAVTLAAFNQLLTAAAPPPSPPPPARDPHPPPSSASSEAASSAYERAAPSDLSTEHSSQHGEHSVGSVPSAGGSDPASEDVPEPLTSGAPPEGEPPCQQEEGVTPATPSPHQPGSTRLVPPLQAEQQGAGTSDDGGAPDRAALSEHTAATQGAGSEAGLGSLRGGVSLPTSPERPSRTPGSPPAAEGCWGSTELGTPAAPAGSSDRFMPMFLQTSSARRRSSEWGLNRGAAPAQHHSAPPGSLFAAAAMEAFPDGAAAGEQGASLRINTRRSSGAGGVAAPAASSAAQTGQLGASSAAISTPQPSQPLSARLSASIPAFFSRLRSSSAEQQHALRDQVQGEQEAQRRGERRSLEAAGQLQAERSPSPGDQEPGRRAALVRSASFSAVAAAAGWLKAQHWLMEPQNCLTGTAPQPPHSIQSWGEAEAWLTSCSTWAALSAALLRHDAMLYRKLLSEIVKTTALCPLGALAFLEQYARRYVGELPGDVLPAQQVGAALLAICQATVMAHLFDPGRLVGGRWSVQQGLVAAAVQSLLSVLSTAFPVAQTRHKAGAFLQHLSAATAASQGLEDTHAGHTLEGDPVMGGGYAGYGLAAAAEGSGDGQGGLHLMKQLLGSYLEEAIAGWNSPP